MVSAKVETAQGAMGALGGAPSPVQGDKGLREVILQQSWAREEAGEGEDAPELEFLVRGTVIITHLSIIKHN